MAKVKQDILHGKISEQLLLFFYPIMFGSIFQQLYNTADAMVVGNYVGKEALAAVGGSTGTFINLLLGFTIGLSSGATVVIAQSYGNRNREAVRKGVYSGMYLALLLGIALMIIGYFVSPFILQLLGVPEDIYDYSLIYLRIFMMGSIPSMLYNTGAAILRAVGDSKRPLYFLTVAVIVNIVLDFIFVVFFKMEVLGVALATVISQVISCILTLLTLYQTEDSYHFNIVHLHHDKRTLYRIIMIGLPIGIQSSLYALANLFIQAGINKHGTDTIAAYTAFGKIDAIFWNTSGALGTSVLTFVGQNYGAGNEKRVRSGMWTGVRLYLIMSLTITIIVYFFGGVIYRIFTPDEAVIDIGMQLLRFLCPFWSAFCFVEIFSQGMRACGDTVMPMFITLTGVGALRIAWILFYPSQTIFDTLLCYPLSWIITSLIYLAYYYQGHWIRKGHLAQKES